MHVRPLEPNSDPLGEDLPLDSKGNFYVVHAPPGPRLVWFTGPEVTSPKMTFRPSRNILAFHAVPHALGDDRELVFYAHPILTMDCE